MVNITSAGTKKQVVLQQSKIELFAKALGTTSRDLVGDIDSTLPKKSPAKKCQ